MAFTPRLSDYGITGNPLYYSDNPFYQAGYGMPNCTAYAWARFYEEGTPQTRPTLSTGNAENWYPYTADGYARGNTPKLGAVCCLAGGPYQGVGHVCIVEQINSDGSIVTSNSGYQSTFFWLETRNPPDYNTEGYTFQGFIYNPYVEGSAPPEPSSWITGNRYLSRSEMDNNAIKFYYTMSRLGVGYNAILGMLANLEVESNINPAIWENLEPYQGGYGLVQWTPYTKYSEWAGSGWEGNGQKECERVVYEAEQGLQWFSNWYAPQVGYPEVPPISFSDYITSNLSPKILADYWVLYYEHPNEAYIQSRIDNHQTLVDYYNNLLGGGAPVSSKIKWWLSAGMIRRRKNANRNSRVAITLWN